MGSGNPTGVALTNVSFTGALSNYKNIIKLTDIGGTDDGVVASGWGTLGGTVAYGSGASSCTNGTQVVTFTNHTNGLAATGTITVSGNVPTGNVTITVAGNGYTVGVPPTQGTVATCTGTATFTGGTITPVLSSIAVLINGSSSANFTLNKNIKNVTTGYYVASAVTTPGSASIYTKNIDSGVTTPINYQAGSATGMADTGGAAVGSLHITGLNRHREFANHCHNSRCREVSSLWIRGNHHWTIYLHACDGAVVHESRRGYYA